MRVRLIRTSGVVLLMALALPVAAQAPLPHPPIAVRTMDQAAGQGASPLGSHLLPLQRPGEMRGAPGSTPPPVTAPDEALPYLGGRALEQPRSGEASPLAVPQLPIPGFYPADLSNPQNGPTLVTTQFHSLYVNCPSANCWGNPDQFQADLVRSPFIQVVDQYVQSSTPNRYSVGPAGLINVALSTTTLSAQDILAIVHAGAATFGAGGGHLYHVFLPPGVDTCDHTGQCYSPDQPSTFVFCAYHSAVNFSDLGVVLYTVEPYQAVQGCQVPAGSPNGAADSTYSTLSHEIFEAISDPIPGQGWTALNSSQVFGAEMGDLCGGPHAVLNLNGHLYATQLEYSNTYHGCVAQP